MSTTANVSQTTYDAILHAYGKLQRACDVLQKQAVVLTHLSAVRADQVKKADSARDDAIESQLKLEREVPALRQRAETAEASSARLEQQLLQKFTQDPLEVQRELEVQLAMQQEEVQDGNTEATGANEALEKTHEKEFAAPLKTSTTPRKETRTGQGGRARVLAGVKDVAASVGAGTTAGSRARVRPATARTHVGATASTACSRARVEATAAARASIPATAGTGASSMSPAKKQTLVKTGGRRIAMGNGC